MLKTSLITGLMIVVLQGCSSVTQGPTHSAPLAAEKETLLRETGDHDKLVSHFKSHLKRQPDDESARLKLVQAYLDGDDLDSADFYFQTLAEGTQRSSQGLLLQARIAFAQGDMAQTIEIGSIAHQQQPSFPELENLLGMAFASQGDVNQAWHYFYLARKHFFDDVTIKNNLAVIDILLEDYQLAVSRLEPLYISGNRDQKLVANLALAYAKSGEYESFKSLYGHRYNAGELDELYMGLRMVTVKQTSTLE